MKAVVQRATQANVTVDGESLERISKEFLVLLRVTGGSTRQMAEKMADKTYHLRIFEDENGKTGLSLEDVEGELLVISQFTLYADYCKGDRFNFTKAGAPRMAESLCKYSVERYRIHADVVEKGRLRVDTRVEFLSDGSFTLMLDSQELSGGQETEELATGERRATWCGKELQTGPVERRQQDTAKMMGAVLYYSLGRPETVKYMAMMKSVLVRMDVHIKNMGLEQVPEKAGCPVGVKGYEAAGGSAGTDRARTQGADGERAGVRPGELLIISEKIMILKQFSSQGPGMSLAGLRRAGVSRIALRAVLTEHNSDWTFHHLYQELKEEHETTTVGQQP